MRRHWGPGFALVMALAGNSPLAAQGSGAANPHGAFAPGKDCSDCHTAAGWRTLRSPLTLDHSAFPLTGRHATVACSRCHLALRFDEPAVAPGECTACHADIHRGNLPGACTRCHTTTSFRDVPATGLHSRTGFPLTGAHLRTPCEGCHQTERNGSYSAVARECLACHRSALAAATTVDHGGFPRDCATCHGPFSWSGGVAFDHAAAARGFALQEAHAALRCQGCHTTGNALRFAPPPATSADCVACHRPDYQRAHGTSGFPTTCTSCHTQRNWDANFDHSAEFPITSGPHRVSCATCHATPGNFQGFTCLTCHEHSQASMDSRHRNRSGYTYDSPACYRCHPRGKAD